MTASAGRTDGEAIERTWSTHNHLSGSTSKMTPGFRLDTLELHFSDWNIQKTRKMGVSLHNDLLKAREQVEIHTAEYKELCDGLPPKSTDKWILEEKNFDISQGEQNIYKAMAEKAPSKSMVLSSLKELENPMSNAADSEDPSTTVAWVNEGLEIEENQLRDHVLLARARTSLWERILNWHEQSPLESGDIELNKEEPEFPENQPITLPSSLPHIARPRDLADLELQLREGQANDALRTIRGYLSQKLVLTRARKDNRSQHSGRLLNDAAEKFKAPMNLAVSQYRRAYDAMIQLGMRQENPVYRPLLDSDITTSKVFDVKRSVGRGYEKLSWIWSNSGAMASGSFTDSWLEEVNRDRWIEEAELLEIELNRTRQYFGFLSQRWESFGQRRLDGWAAYGKRMAAMYRVLANDVHKLMLTGLWRFTRHSIKLHDAQCPADTLVSIYYVQATDIGDVCLVFAAVKETILQNAFPDTGFC
ncbi:11061_t:CDS:2 [Acaulospora colombiana]|uniref:11061_t:CDS:1 n=1 Tax=Acaulospora colombiana TaxID=27376 RepID=A0ACA9LAH0_9GLOM|nr:11061_t:CDS:2 [Acaulospora colombiana]